MKKTLKILKNISTIIGAIVLTFLMVGIIYWGIDTDSFQYGRNSLVSSENLENEGPFIFEKDSVYQINYINGNSEKGFFLNQQIENADTDFSVKCYYYPDSTDFSFTLKTGFQNEKFEYDKPEKILAISDIESNYRIFRDFLKINKVIDENLNWIFGKGHLVLNGDFIDRSYFTTQVLWFIYKLEQDAEMSGGKVHYILGNHEIMNIQGDNRYSKNKYKNIASILQLKQYQLYDTTLHIGKWIKTKNIIEKIGDILFVHGGLSPDYVKENIDLSEINKMARENYQTAYFPKQNQLIMEKIILSSKTSPYWYRGYYEDDLPQYEIDQILNYYNCSQIVVGHTIQKEVSRAYNGKVIGIDIKHPRDYYKYFPKLHMQGLLIENEKFYRIDDEGKKAEI
jgi:hypothetical protein